jgi:hypothetical protein
MFIQIIVFSLFLPIFGSLHGAARDIPHKKDNDDKLLVRLVLQSPNRDIKKIENLFPCEDELGHIPVGVYDPGDIVAKGCSPEIFFRTRILPNEEDLMKISWLNNLFDSSHGHKIGQEIRDRMLLDVCSDRRSSTSLIEALLVRGADPCMGTKSSVERVFDRLSEKGADVMRVSEQLLLLVTYVCRGPHIFQQEHESYYDATQSYIDRLNLRIDTKELLRKKFGKFGNKQSEEACVLNLDIWNKICDMLNQKSFQD